MIELFFGVMAFAGVLFFDPPEVFSRLTYDEARAFADQTGKYLVVSSSAEPCEPCRAMDETAWNDAEVVDWVRERAVAVRLRVDLDPRTAAMLGIGSVPWVTVLKEGRELDHESGLDAAGLLRFLREVEGGRRGVDRWRALAGDRNAEKVDIRVRLSLARALLLAKEYDEATDEYSWLWNHMLEHDAAMAPVRMGQFVGDLSRLIREHEPARESFSLQRDLLADEMDTGLISHKTLVDWVCLNEALDEESRTLEWIDHAAPQEEGSVAIARLFPLIKELLYDNGRWAIAGRMIPEPKDAMQRTERMLDLSTPPTGADGPAVMAHEARKRMVLTREAARLYAGALAAGLDLKATEVLWWAKLKHKDGEMLRAMVETALSAGEPRAEQARLLEGAEFEDLRARVQAALDDEKK